MINTNFVVRAQGRKVTAGTIFAYNLAWLHPVYSIVVKGGPVVIFSFRLQNHTINSVYTIFALNFGFSAFSRSGFAVRHPVVSAVDVFFCTSNKYYPVFAILSILTIVGNGEVAFARDGYVASFFAILRGEYDPHGVSIILWYYCSNLRQ